MKRGYHASSIYIPYLSFPWSEPWNIWSGPKQVFYGLLSDDVVRIVACLCSNKSIYTGFWPTTDTFFPSSTTKRCLYRAHPWLIESDVNKEFIIFFVISYYSDLLSLRRCNTTACVAKLAQKKKQQRSAWFKMYFSFHGMPYMSSYLHIFVSLITIRLISSFFCSFFFCFLVAIFDELVALCAKSDESDRADLHSAATIQMLAKIFRGEENKTDAPLIWQVAEKLFINP